jgi:purine nucleosidase
MAAPLIHRHENAHFFHGDDGLGGKNYPLPERSAEDMHAVQAMIDTVRAHPGIVIVTLGPVTNLALAVRQAPDIVEQVSRCVVMGGAAATYGNITPAAEYNIWCDPEAARIVFHSGMPVEMVGWEFCINQYALNDDEIQTVLDFNTPLAEFAVECNEVAIEAFYEQTGQRGLSLPDPVTMAVALDRSLATQEMHYVEVEINSPLTRGMTVVDKLDVAATRFNRENWADAIEAGKIRVTWDVDSPGWKQLLYDLLQQPVSESGTS